MNKTIVCACTILCASLTSNIIVASQTKTQSKSIKDQLVLHIEKTKKQVANLWSKLSIKDTALPGLPAEQGLIMRPFFDLTHAAQRKGVSDVFFTPDMSRGDLASYYVRLLPRFDAETDKASRDAFMRSYQKAATIQQYYQNHTAEFNFATNNGTYIVGEIPAKIPVPPFRYGLIKKDNPDRAHIGEIVCFGPLRYKDGAGTVVEVRNKQAMADCFKANADTSEFGCHEVLAEIFVDQGHSCANSCWNGYDNVEGANCSIPAL